MSLAQGSATGPLFCAVYTGCMRGCSCHGGMPREIYLNIIILTAAHGAARSLTFGRGALFGLLTLIVSLPLLGAWLTWLAMGAADIGGDASSEPFSAVPVQAVQTSDHAPQQVEYMARQLARLQSRMARLDALGERLTELTGLDDGEFDFVTEPAVGGPADRESLPVDLPDVERLLESLSLRIESRTEQLRLMEQLLVSQQINDNATLDFLPVPAGMRSSGFGRRVDPFSGRISMHAGLDFSAPRGTPIHAVGDGVVSFAGRNGAYGNMLEITHAGGYTSIYAHAHSLAVEKGDLVEKGQLIATVGSTGRSTGPHLHLEIRRNGMAVNPARFIAFNQSRQP